MNISKKLKKITEMISIIIIVKDDIGVKNTIEKLSKIRKSCRSEILVIDSSRDKLADFKKEYPYVNWYYFHSKTNKKVTIPEQRNLGIKKSKGSIVVFIDANCIPEDNWLYELIKPINMEKESIVAGSIKSLGKKSIWDAEEVRIKSKKYLTEASTMNMAFRKKIIKDIGFFDEKFNYGSDIDFCWRATEKGYKIRRAKKAILYHDWRSLKEEIKRSFNYGKARISLYRKHLNRWRNLFSYDFVSLIYPLYILLLPLTFFCRCYPLLIIVPIIKNIKKKPLKVIFINLIFGLGILQELFLTTKIRKLKK